MITTTHRTSSRATRAWELALRATLITACKAPGMAPRMLALGLVAASLVATAQPAPAQTVSTLSAPTGAANVTTSSGLIYTSLKEGSGASPQATDTVRVHYRGTFQDGKEFDSSYSRGQPAQFPLNRVIRCWTEGVQMIKVGGKARLVCPPAIAYGERGTPGGPIPPNATLYFEVELLGIAGK
jgi:FKBP-type peptidyl-prolyl cis-trans isomerase FkpA